MLAIGSRQPSAGGRRRRRAHEASRERNSIEIVVIVVREKAYTSGAGPLSPWRRDRVGKQVLDQIG